MRMQTIVSQRFPRKLASCLALGLCLGSGGTLPVLAYPAWLPVFALLSTGDLTDLVRDPSLKVSALSTTVIGTGPSVTVLTEENAQASDENLKIDAIFLSKALILGAHGQVETVKVLFSQSSKEGRYIIIPKRDIDDYGSGKITADKLLASLHFNAVEQEEAPAVAPGIDFERRLLVWRRIEKLKQQGTGVSPFEKISQEIEGLAKAGETQKVAERLTFIESKLSEQEAQVRQARVTAHSSAVASPRLPGQSSGGGLPPMGAGGSLPVPPDIAAIKQRFENENYNLIQAVGAQNATLGKHLQTMQGEIRQQIANHQDGSAFNMMREFAQIVQEQLHLQVVPFGIHLSGPGGQQQEGGPQQQARGFPGGGPPQQQGGRQGQGNSVWGRGNEQGGPPGPGGPGQGGPGPGGGGGQGPGPGGPGGPGGFGPP